MLNKLRTRRMRVSSENSSGEEKPLEPPNQIMFAIAQLTRWVQSMIMPGELWKTPYLADNGGATQAAHNAGMADASSDPFDIYSTTPRMPHENTVLSIAMELVDKIGGRARDILVALEAGNLTEHFTVEPAAQGWKATSLRTKVLMVMAATFEMVLGSKLIETLTSVPDFASWAVGVAMALVLTASSLSIAHAIHIQQPSLLRGKGMWIAVAVVGLGMIFLTAYAIGLGGGAEARPESGGLSGGNAPGSESGPADPGINWMLAIIYLALLGFLLASVVLSHLNDLYDAEKRRVSSSITAQDARSTPEVQCRLAIGLLWACLTLVPEAKHRVQELIRAYVGGGRTVLPPHLNSIWNTNDLENRQIPDPGWMQEIRDEIERLERQVQRSGGDGSPPVSLVGVP